MRYMKPFNLFIDLLKTNALEKGRLLGLDVGDKYVGLAVSDSHNKVAAPLSVSSPKLNRRTVKLSESVLHRKKSNMDIMASNLQDLIAEHSVGGFIVGCPFDGWKACADAVQVKVFIDDLCETGKLKGLRYTYWNECFTSKNVDFLPKSVNLHPVASKTMIDKFAAVGILQGYLDFVNKKLERESSE